MHWSTACLHRAAVYAVRFSCNAAVSCECFALALLQAHMVQELLGPVIEAVDKVHDCVTDVGLYAAELNQVGDACNNIRYCSLESVGGVRVCWRTKRGGWCLKQCMQLL